MDNSDFKVYVLIATYNRTQLLKERAIPSVVNQTIPVDFIVLVDDSDSEIIKEKNLELINGIIQFQTKYLENTHNPGAGGGWNCGIEWIFNENPNAWIAILDDDDEWSKNHIEMCLKYTEDSDAVISGIETIKNLKGLERKRIYKFEYKDFLKGNPGWQGSNTFIRAQFISSIGGFDENLLCTHDRDLAIRCLMNPHFRYKILKSNTVKYYLEENRTSLTIPNGFGKITGLLQFYKKHKEIMTYSNKLNFINRAKNLFDADPKLFNLLEKEMEEYSGFKKAPNLNIDSKKGKIRNFYLKIKKLISQIRMNKFVSFFFGPQFKRSRDLIEIDITYECNLHCNNCNRSCSQAPEKIEISLDKISNFVNNSIEKQIYWKRIRILGGEPTLHSKLEIILYSLLEYKKFYPYVKLEVVTNGFGNDNKRKILKIPPFFSIENSYKKDQNQMHFSTFNLAPKDFKKYRNVDYRNGCSVLKECGIGLTPLGYYPCALAGGIDRIMQRNNGRKEIPSNNDDMEDLLEKFCPLCGRFKDRIFIPYNLRKKITKNEISLTWKKFYGKWRIDHE